MFTETSLVSSPDYHTEQEAQLSPSDTTSPDQSDGMKLERVMNNVHSRLNRDATESAPIVSGVINKPTTVELCVSHVYRRLAVAKFSKSTM